MNTIEYKNYVGTVEYDASDMCFYVTVEGMKDLLMTEADDAKTLDKNFRNLVDEYLADCEELGREPAQQASGHFQVRIDPSLHAKAKAYAKAKSAKTSLNEVVTEALRLHLAT